MKNKISQPVDDKKDKKGAARRAGKNLNSILNKRAEKGKFN